MQDQVSPYQSLKIWLAHYVPIDRDILHVLIGLALLLVAFVLARKSKSATPFYWALVIAFSVAVGMETLDMIDDVRSLDTWRWRASILDILRTIACPLLASVAVFLLKAHEAHKNLT